MAKKQKSKARNARSSAKPNAAPARFDLDNPVLPKGMEEASLTSGGYPYDKKMKRGEFEDSAIVIEGDEEGIESGIEVSSKQEPVVDVEALGVGCAFRPRLDVAGA